MALYRAGRLHEAIRRLTEVTAAWQQAGKMPTRYSPAYTCFFLAMGHHRLGQPEKARECLDRAVKAAEEELRPEAGAGWNRRLTLKLLRHEAETLLGTTPTSAPSRGKDMIPARDPRP